MMRAASGHIVVEPTGDNNESEHGRLIVVNNEKPQHKVMRGVVIDLGGEVERLDERAEKGQVVHYTAFHEIGRWHIVPLGNVIAWDDA